MSRKLDILVPQYKETDEVIKPLLDSIAIQQSINFEDIGVIICNDGSDVFLSDKLLNSYPFKIEYYKEEHKGVSATRNACLDHSTADYVMFCDADDMFYNACGIWIIFQAADKEGFDSLTSVFVEETRIPGTKEITYINHEMDKHSKNIYVYGIDSAFMTEFDEHDYPVLDEDSDVFPLTLLVDDTMREGELRLAVPTSDDGDETENIIIDVPNFE
jgi:glycosyltransferase involved in cell wall biosynthesis